MADHPRTARPDGEPSTAVPAFVPARAEADALLYVERPDAAMHVGSVMVFDDGPDGPLDGERLLELVRSRIAYAPRYRQRLRSVPGGLGAPVWVTDAELDLSYHVRRAALPRPGSDVQLQELVARVQARPLDRSRPLWEVYLVEGVAENRFAIVTKIHQALVDGVRSVDLAHLLFDDVRLGEDHPGAGWSPGREPSDLELVTGAVLGAARSPARMALALRGGAGEIAQTVTRLGATVADVAGMLLRTAARPAPTSPLYASVGSARRFVMVGVDLDELRVARGGAGAGDAQEHVTVNDVVLAVVTGALRRWLESRGEHVTRSATVRALVPVSVAELGTAPGGEVMACFVDLPVGEPAPTMRLYQVAYQMRRELSGGAAVGATTLSEAAGFAAPTLHVLGSRLSTAMARRLFSLVVTNVPGPQTPLAVDGHPMVSTFPVVPLVHGQALSIGVSSYAGGVFFGLNADRDAVPDLDVLGAAIVEALDDLSGSHPRPSRRRPRRTPVARIYAPVTATDLEELAAGRSVRLDAWSAAPVGLAGEALEEAEYEALVEAAAVAGERAGAGTRRVVVAADVEVDVDPTGGGSPLDVAPRRVASFHVDETTEHRDEDLLWYDVSEIDDVVRLARG